MKKQIGITFFSIIFLILLSIFLKANYDENSFLLSSSKTINNDISSNNLILESNNLKTLYDIAEKEKIKKETMLEITKNEAESLRIQNVNFNEYDLTQVSNITYEEMYEILSNSTMQHLSYAIVEAERKYNVNAFFIASLIALESGWATSSKATTYNNLTGMAVYNNISRGTVYDSQEQCIYDTTKQIKENYLTPGGQYNRGLSTISVNKFYCTSDDWHVKINIIAYELLSEYDKIFRGD